MGTTQEQAGHSVKELVIVGAGGLVRDQHGSRA